MPTYEYECEKCGSVFEEFQSITAEPLQSCRRDGCDGRVHRLLSPGAGFIFKGSGFYSTDYRSESYKKAAKADSPGDSGKKEGSGSTKEGSSSDSSSAGSKDTSSDSSKSSA